MVQLQRVQEESRRAANAKHSTAASVNEDAGRDATHPNINDIRRWREVIVAMLKPHTDFGWHHHGSNDGDAAKTMRRSLSSKGFEARAGGVGGSDDNGDESDIVDDAESKTVLQIHDAGEKGVEMVCHDNSKAMVGLPDLGTDKNGDETKGVEGTTRKNEESHSQRLARVAQLAPQHREAALEALQAVHRLHKAAMEASQRLECLLAGESPPVLVMGSIIGSGGGGRDGGGGGGGHTRRTDDDTSEEIEISA